MGGTVKNKIYQFTKMVKDADRNKVPEGTYYHAHNIRFISTSNEILGGFHFEKGNKLLLKIPKPSLNVSQRTIDYQLEYYNDNENVLSVSNRNIPVMQQRNGHTVFNFDHEVYYTYNGKTSGNQTIIGWVNTVKGIVLMSTDNNGFDCVWLLYFDESESEYDLKLLYMRNMGLSVNHPVEILNNYENENVDKIYWVDGVHQLRHLNINQSLDNSDQNLIDVDSSLINAISAVNISQAKLKEINFGGSHTSGMIQYTYILYKLNGSQTTFAPVSNLIPLSKGDQGGGAVNELVGSAPTIIIENLDKRYDNILVFAIKYTSYNGTPQVSVIEDRSIPDNGKIEVYDDGSILYNSSLEEIKLINNSLVFPNAIASKDNSLFLANFKENSFKLNLNMKLYQFEETGKESIVLNNITLNSNDEVIGEQRIVRPNTLIPVFNYNTDPNDDFDNVNPDYDKYAYRNNSSKTRGADGKYAYIELTHTTINDGTQKFLKDNELYRVGVRFYNTFGQATLPIWLCDFKTPQGNLEGRYNILKFGLKPEFYNKISTMNLDEYGKPVGYELLIAERTNSDKTIISSGLINPMMITNTQSVSGVFHETYNDGKLIRVIPSKYDELDNILKTKVKSPNPAFRNTWLDYNKIDHEILSHIPAEPSTSWNTLITRLIDSPLQKASHYRNLNSTLIAPTQGIGLGDTTLFRFLSEFPTSKDKPDRYWNYQDSKIMQLYSPEAIFGNIPILPDNCDLKVRYAYKNTENYVWERMVESNTNAILIDAKIKNRLAATVNAEQSTINNVDWMNQGQAGLYNDMISLSQDTNKAHIQSRPLPYGWSRSGMFSNYWGDIFGDVGSENVTKVQLFYRRYGNKMEDVNKGYYNPNLGVDIGQETLPVPTLPFQSIVATSTSDASNIEILPSVFNDFPEANKVKVKTTFTNLNTSSDNDRNIITIKSGIKGVDQEDLILSKKTINSQVINEVVINKADLDLDPIVISNGVSVNIQDEFEINGTIGYDLDISIMNDDIVIENSISNLSLNYNVIGGNHTGPIVSISNDIIKPNQTGTGITSYKIYGRPHFNTKGQSTKDYNSDGFFKYTNSLKNVGSNNLGGTNNSTDKTVYSINADGVESITFVLNPATKDNNKNAISYEDMAWDAKFKVDSFRSNLGSMYAEITRSKRDVYLGGIYGGNSFEDKKRTKYLAIGNYTPIERTDVVVYSPGDTFVQDFKFLRIIRGDVSKLTPSIIEHEEILEYLTETTIDLKNRNDRSFTQWDSDFSYSEDDYHKYNRVYSQQNLVTLTRDLDYNFRPVDYFNNTIMGSKKKINGEYIDSWLQPLVNDSLDLDGKQGPINRLLSFNDNIFAMQDRGVASLRINPKIQYSDISGTELQLGTGKLLDGYEYITTTKGSLKWNCISTDRGIYFVDIIDKSINSISREGVEDLSVINGLKHFTIKNINFDDYKGDNPIIDNGISLGYDNTRGDIYMTFAKDNNKFTLCYNTIQNGFSSFYDYNSPFYIPHKGEIYSVNPNNKGLLYKSFAGKYNKFYNQTKDSVIEFIANPEYLIETTFNNLEFKDEAINDINGNELVKSFDSIRVTNEFQDSGEIELKPKFNIRKLNRKWRLNIPRDNNKINRIRNTWSKIRLTSHNQEHLNHKINDIILFYTPNYKKIT